MIIYYDKILYVHEFFYIPFVMIPLFFINYGLLVNFVPLRDINLTYDTTIVGFYFLTTVTFVMFFVLMILLTLFIITKIDSIISESKKISISEDISYIFVMWLNKNYPEFKKEQYEGWDGSVDYSSDFMVRKLYFSVFEKNIEEQENYTRQKEIRMLKKYMKKNKEMVLFKLL